MTNAKMRSEFPYENYSYVYEEPSWICSKIAFNSTTNRRWAQKDLKIIRVLIRAIKWNMMETFSLCVIVHQMPNELYGLCCSDIMYQHASHFIRVLLLHSHSNNAMWRWHGSMLSCIHIYIFIKGYSVARFFLLLLLLASCFLSDINATNVTVCTFCVCLGYSPSFSIEKWMLKHVGRHNTETNKKALPFNASAVFVCVNVWQLSERNLFSLRPIQRTFASACVKQNTLTHIFSTVFSFIAVFHWTVVNFEGSVHCTAAIQ